MSKTTDPKWGKVQAEFEQGGADAHALQQICPNFPYERSDNFYSHIESCYSAIERNDQEAYAYNNGWLNAWNDWGPARNRTREQ